MCDTFISFCETITCVVDSMGSYDYIVIGIMKNGNSMHARIKSDGPNS